jgi:hypothetical protein
MWEARVAPGQLAAAELWVRQVLLPRALEAGAVRVEGFRADGAEPRVVAITRWTARSTWVEPQPDEAVVLRAHAWEFEELEDDS